MIELGSRRFCYSRSRAKREVPFSIYRSSSRGRLGERLTSAKISDSSDHARLVRSPRGCEVDCEMRSTPVAKTVWNHTPLKRQPSFRDIPQKKKICPIVNDAQFLRPIQINSHHSIHFPFHSKIFLNLHHINFSMEGTE
jgi:hypothetical protein